MEIVKQAALNKLGKFTKADIMELCPTVGRASIENALKNLLKKTSSFATAADARRSIQKRITDVYSKIYANKHSLLTEV